MRRLVSTILVTLLGATLAGCASYPDRLADEHEKLKPLPIPAKPRTAPSGNRAPTWHCSRIRGRTGSAT